MPGKQLRGVGVRIHDPDSRRRGSEEWEVWADSESDPLRDPHAARGQESCSSEYANVTAIDDFTVDDGRGGVPAMRLAMRPHGPPVGRECFGDELFLVFAKQAACFSVVMNACVEAREAGGERRDAERVSNDSALQLLICR